MVCVAHEIDTVFANTISCIAVSSFICVLPCGLQVDDYYEVKMSKEILHHQR